MKKSEDRCVLNFGTLLKRLLQKFSKHLKRWHTMAQCDSISVNIGIYYIQKNLSKKIVLLYL